MIQSPHPEFSFLATRRESLFGVAGVLSATAVALLAGHDVLARNAKDAPAATDVQILNRALAAELEAIAAYQVGAGSGLLSAAAKTVALQFQGHHRAHADVLAGTVRKLGGQAVDAKQAYDFPTASLKAEADVLRFAAGLERGAVSAYVQAVPLFHDRALAQAAATILGDEAMHWAVFRQILGEQPVVPAAFVG